MKIANVPDVSLTFPWLVLTYLGTGDHHRVAWSGPLDAGNVRLLADSPARQEIARRLLAGDAVVWVLLESGDAGKDDATASRAVAPSLALPFSILRVSPTDPAERVFVQMLLGSEPDIAASRQRMTFPIFGQGRCFVFRARNRSSLNSASRFRETSRSLLPTETCDSSTSERTAWTSTFSSTKASLRFGGNSDSRRPEPRNLGTRGRDRRSIP